METWQIKVLALEVAALNDLDGFIRSHALYFLVGAIYLLLALFVWVLASALRPRPGKLRSCVPPVIVIHLSETPPPAEPEFNPFPPLWELPHDYDRDDYPWD